MSRAKSKPKPSLTALRKSPTGVKGLDEITGGGLPQGRLTLVCGAAGCGKTMLGMEFLARGALEYGEPGVFMAFEETAEELIQNVASLGFDLGALVARGQLALDHVDIERSEIEETGEFDLDGLFIRLAYAIDSVGAKRVVLDTIEALFAGLPNEMTLRAELRRLFRWLKDRGVTAVITAERGDGTLTRHGLEEYISDCVILLDNRVTNQVTTRRLRVVKYRGSAHGTNEYPFLMDGQGISVLPITSVRLEHRASTERISTGVARLDVMLGGQGGYYRGSSILLSGTAGTGKSSLAAHFIGAACGRGERGLYLAFEESEHQIVRNMRTVGLDLGRWVKEGLLRIHPARPTLYGLEMHLAVIGRLIAQHRPSVVVIDPVTNLTSVGTRGEVEAALNLLLDQLKAQGITAVFTSLTFGGDHPEQSEVGISSLIDTWILLRNLESNGERNRGLYVLKSRGMAHSNQIQEFFLTDRGVELRDAYLGTEGVLMGTARAAQEARDKAAELARGQEIERKQRELARKREALERQVSALCAAFEAEAEEMERLIMQDRVGEVAALETRAEMVRLRRSEVFQATARLSENVRPGDYHANHLQKEKEGGRNGAQKGARTDREKAKRAGG